MEAVIKASLLRGGFREMDLLSGRMEVHIRENGRMTCRMDKAFIQDRTDIKLKHSGKRAGLYRKKRN
jgi:hypothetical protein